MRLGLLIVVPFSYIIFGYSGVFFLRVFEPARLKAIMPNNNTEYLILFMYVLLSPMLKYPKGVSVQSECRL
jgi:hypothetical protein